MLYGPSNVRVSTRFFPFIISLMYLKSQNFKPIYYFIEDSNICDLQANPGLFVAQSGHHVVSLSFIISFVLLIANNFSQR